MEPEVTLQGVGIDSALVPEVPREVSVTLAIRYDIPWRESVSLSPASFGLVVIDPDLEITFNRVATITLSPPGPHHPEGWDNHNHSVFRLAFWAEVAGLYQIKVQLGDDAPLILPFSVKLADTNRPFPV